ncbi:hypothetical protein BFW90_13835 [Pseudomonas fluorescens]|nr:hypothetical protein BFW90_13835 [Pseudomonas fluorescens]
MGQFGAIGHGLEGLRTESVQPHDPIVGAGLPAMTACQPTPIYLTPCDQPVGAGLLAKAA